MPDLKLWLQAVGRGSRGMLQAAKQLKITAHDASRGALIPNMSQPRRGGTTTV